MPPAARAAPIERERQIDGRGLMAEIVGGDQPHGVRTIRQCVAGDVCQQVGRQHEANPAERGQDVVEHRAVDACPQGADRARIVDDAAHASVDSDTVTRVKAAVVREPDGEAWRRRIRRGGCEGCIGADRVACRIGCNDAE